MTPLLLRALWVLLLLLALGGRARSLPAAAAAPRVDAVACVGMRAEDPGAAASR